MKNTRLLQQISFIKEIEKLKTVYRKNMVIDKSRAENSAEHSWHLALMALVLSEHANQPDLDLSKVVLMLLLHDLVEIDAGDTWAYDEKGYEDKNERESKGAERLFGLLPHNQAKIFKETWEEFEERESKEAIFAASLDGMQPILNHLWTGGDQIKDQKLASSKVLQKKQYIKDGSDELWKYSTEAVSDSVEAGIYTDE